VTDTGGSGEVIGLIVAGFVIACLIWLAGKTARYILAG
jgi:hypothetical protein